MNRDTELNCMELYVTFLILMMMNCSENLFTFRHLELYAALMFSLDFANAIYTLTFFGQYYIKDYLIFKIIPEQVGVSTLLVCELYV